MGMKHEAKKGTVIQIDGASMVQLTVLRGNPLLEITTLESGAVITTTDPESARSLPLGQNGINGFLSEITPPPQPR